MADLTISVDHFDKENENCISPNSKISSSATDGSRTPLSSMPNGMDDVAAEDRRNDVELVTAINRLPLNAPAIVQPPPVIYQDSAATLPDVAFIDEEDVGLSPSPSRQDDGVTTPVSTFANLEAKRIVLDSRFTPVTPDDCTPRPVTSSRKFPAKCYVAEDVGDLQNDIRLNSLIIQKVEVMMSNKNKEYSDQLDLRDGTISALEKEVKMLKDATVVKGTISGKVPTHPETSTKNVPKSTSSLTRTWSTRISKKERQDANERIMTRGKSGLNAETKPASCGTFKKPDATKTYGGVSTTLPRPKRVAEKVGVTTTLPRKVPSRTESLRTSQRLQSAKKVEPKNKPGVKAKIERPKPTPGKNLKKTVESSGTSCTTSTRTENANSKSCVSPRLNNSGQKSPNVSIEERDPLQSKDSEVAPDQDFVAHLKRLTEEHEKLQIEYARLRVQMVESGTSSTGDRIPEGDENADEDDGKDLREKNEKLNNVLNGYKNETTRLQEELRRVQRKYWEQKLGSESIETELQCASKQVVDLIDKLDDATCELKAEKRKSAEVAKHLSGHSKKNVVLTSELEEANELIHRLQLQLSNVVDNKNKLTTSIKDMETESRETQDFLMAERNAALESLQEAEKELQTCNSNTEKYKSLLTERKDQCHILTDKLEQKELYLQMLQAELESTQNRARDMLLSQGAEITGASIALSEISHRIKAVIKTTMVSNNLNEAAVKKLFKANGLDFKDKKHHTSPKTNKNEEDLANGNVVASENSNLVQSILNAIDNAKESEDTNDDNDDNKKDQEFGNCESPDNTNKNNSAVQRPVGFVTPFHSKSALKPILEEEPIGDNKNGKDNWDDDPSDTGSSSTNTLEDGTADVINEINSLNMLVSKFAVISGMVQDNLSNKIHSLEAEKKSLRDKFESEQSENKSAQSELQNKMATVEIELMDSRRQERLLTATKSKLTNLCEGHERTIKNLNKDIQAIRMQKSCIESEVKEKRQQLTTALDKISSLVASNDIDYPGLHYVCVAEALSDKFTLKGEIARLQGQLSENEKLLEEMASKFTRNKSILEGNWQKAEAEVQRLDEIIDSVLLVLRQIPNTVQSCKLLSQLWRELGGSENAYSDYQENMQSQSDDATSN